MLGTCARILFVFCVLASPPVRADDDCADAVFVAAIDATPTASTRRPYELSSLATARSVLPPTGAVSFACTLVLWLAVLYRKGRSANRRVMRFAKKTLRPANRGDRRCALAALSCSGRAGRT